MQIDWFTVGAQTVNFLLLVYLLRRFLYRPVVSAMERREQHIAERLGEAARRAEDAARQAEAYRARQQDLDAEKSTILETARSEAESERKALIAAAREEAEERRRTWQGEVEAEKQAFVHRLKREIAAKLLAIAAKAFRDLASAEVEEEAVRVFAARLESLDRADRERLAAACREAAGGVVLATAFPPSKAGRALLTRAIQAMAGNQVAISFERDSDLGLGVELRAPGRRLAWNLDDYLGDLADSIDKALAGGVGLPPPAVEGRR